jgi:hypothetical protein
MARPLLGNCESTLNKSQQLEQQIYAPALTERASVKKIHSIGEVAEFV